MVLMKLYMLLIQYFISVVQVAENFIPPLLDAVLLDYQRNVSAAREPEVLSTMATIVNRLEVQYQDLMAQCTRADKDKNFLDCEQFFYNSKYMDSTGIFCVND